MHENKLLEHKYLVEKEFTKFLAQNSKNKEEFIELRKIQKNLG